MSYLPIDNRGKLTYNFGVVLGSAIFDETNVVLRNRQNVNHIPFSYKLLRYVNIFILLGNIVQDKYDFVSYNYNVNWCYDIENNRRLKL